MNQLSSIPHYSVMLNMKKTEILFLKIIQYHHILRTRKQSSMNMLTTIIAKNKHLLQWITTHNKIHKPRASIHQHV